MWHDENDVINDLVFLNDFGNARDKESYKILYSKGRGKNCKKKSEYPETFIDSRTGEAINLNDISMETVDVTPKKGRGRGSLSKSLANTRFQLQKQLRMARPLGSSDKVIETYYRRNKPADNIQNTEDSCSNDNSKTNENESEIKNLFYQNEKGLCRVKATRNSTSQSNALIEGLLAKAEGKSLGKKEESEETKPVASVIDMETSEKSEDNFNLIYDYEQSSDSLCSSDCSEKYNTKSQDSTSDSSNDPSRSSSPGFKNCNEIYKNLGERLNRFNRLQKNTFERGNRDFRKRFISPVDLDDECINEDTDKLFESQKNRNYFYYDEKEFPALKKQ